MHAHKKTVTSDYHFQVSFFIDFLQFRRIVRVMSHKYCNNQVDQMFFTCWFLDAATAVYAPAHNASAPDGERLPVHPFSMCFEMPLCFEGFIATF